MESAKPVDGKTKAAQDQKGKPASKDIKKK